MTKSDRSSYTPLDFREWHQTGKLVLSPKFQRRGVWTTPARSYLIESMLLEMPISPLYLRVVQDSTASKVVREVVDGQQRISSVLDFMDGKFALAKNLESPVSGKKFKDLSDDQKDRISHYSFICEVFHGVEDSEVLQIFARLNTYSVKLNAQELRNGRFFGPFKRTAYSLAFEHLEFWRRHRIFSERNIARMQEVELTSELMILQLDGLQDKKKSINEFYGLYDDDFPARQKIESRFRQTLDTINSCLGDALSNLEFRRPPLFYSLFGSVYHRVYGVPKEVRLRGGTGKLSAIEGDSLSDAARKLSDLVASAKAHEGVVPKKYDKFVAACLRQTDNVKPRGTRFGVIHDEAFGE